MNFLSPIQLPSAYSYSQEVFGSQKSFESRNKIFFLQSCDNHNEESFWHYIYQILYNFHSIILSLNENSKRSLHEVMYGTSNPLENRAI